MSTGALSLLRRVTITAQLRERTIATPPPRHPLTAFWEQYAFSIGDTNFQWLDVALSAMAHGDWAKFERRLTEGLACASRADAEQVPLPDAAVDEAAAAFRYERDLISGSDMSEWLARVGVSSDDWTAYITRDVLRQMWADDIEELLDRYPPSPRQLEAAAIAEGICSGLFDLFEASLSERAATAFDASPDLFATGRAASFAQMEPATRLVRQHAHWLTTRPEAEIVARLTRILDIDEAYRVVSERLVCDASLQRVIEAHRLDWVLVDLDTITFDDEGAAREAMLCVKEDGLSMQDVGALSRRPVTRERRFLEDVPAAHRDHLLSVEPGCLIGPLLAGGRYQVSAVLGRTTPTLDDGHVGQRARAAFLEQAGRRAAGDHVRRHPR